MLSSKNRIKNQTAEKESASCLLVQKFNEFMASCKFMCDLYGLWVLYLEAIIGPASEFHLTVLIIKWKPGNVYFACGFKNTWGDVCALSLMCHNYIGWICTIKSLISTEEGHGM